MKDQAEKLRQMISKKNNTIDLYNTNNKNTRVLTVTSGKGGVGKTNFTINLALSLCKLGYKVAVLDADIGFANIDVLLGIMPQNTLLDVINGHKNIKDIMEEGPYGLKVIAGGSGLDSLLKLDIEKLNLLTNQLLKLEELVDFIIIDTGAGISKAVINFVSASDEVILVTTPEPTSLTDGYAMLKVLNNHMKRDSVRLVVNRVKNEREYLEVYYKLSKASKKFLSLDLIKLGYLYESKIVSNSVRVQQPFVLSDPRSSISKKINSIAIQLVDSEINTSTSGLRGFLNNIKSFVNRGEF